MFSIILLYGLIHLQIKIQIKKNEHVDSWTGTGINTIFLKVFLTDCDNYNGMTVFPGTHLHGLYPVKIELLIFQRS